MVKGLLELVLHRWDNLEEDQRREYVRKALEATDKVVAAVEIVEAKILHNENITVILEQQGRTRRKDENSDVQNHNVL